MRYLHILTLHVDPSSPVALPESMSTICDEITSGLLADWRAAAPDPHAVHLLKVLDGSVIVIQEEVESPSRVAEWSPLEMPALQVLMEKYPGRLMPFVTVMKKIA